MEPTQPTPGLASPYLLSRRRRAAHTPVVAERMPIEVIA
jgi:hypothetical protein